MSTHAHPHAQPPAALHLQARLQRPGFALDVTLDLPERGVTALLGPSGSGKTTCLRVLAGLEPTAHARVVVGGQVWQDSDQGICLPVHRRALGVVFQEASLFEHLTVAQNLRFGFDRTPKAERRHGWDHGLALLGIGHLLDRRPHELSGGERQRVAIARALATSPRLLLMDEPLAALDQARKADILPWLEQLHQGLDMPVVYVTHALEEAAHLADHVVLLHQGQVQAAGPVADMLTRTDLPLARGDGALAVLSAECRGYSPADALAVYRIDGGELLLPQAPARVPRAGAQVQLHIHARDVSVSLTAPTDSSVLNALPAQVVAVQEDAPGQVIVSLRLGAEGQGARLLSRISAQSARRLALAPGVAVVAQIKGMALLRGNAA